MAVPAIDVLRLLLRYEPDTGKLFWLERPLEFFKSQADCNAWNGRCAGNEAFTAINARGYRVGAIFDSLYRAHRVAWALHHGKWPDAIIDHIDGDILNNRIENLRDVSMALNQRNGRMRRDNTSGHVGVSWDVRKQKWLARMKVNNRYRHLGTYSDINEAIAVRKASEIDHGFTARHGKPLNKEGRDNGCTASSWPLSRRRLADD